jgi:hypothetical protein
VSAAYLTEPAGQRSDHIPALPVTAAARLQLSHHSTAPGKTPGPANSGGIRPQGSDLAKHDTA